jgi:hypothetical protein
MRRKVVFGAWVGVSLALACSMAVFRRGAADAAVLDGFAIHTRDKDVTVTLYTDQRATYSTESQGRQFTIVLPEAQLSKRQMDEGLPVVIDDKNRFIGRAVPTADGKVKIILPNLPSGEYNVSVQQQRYAPPPDTLDTPAIDSRAVAVTPVKAARVPGIHPRPAVKAPPVRHAGPTIVSSRNAASATPETAFSLSQPSRPMRLSASGASDVFDLSGPAARGTIWNPYVVKRSPAWNANPGAGKDPMDVDATAWMRTPPPSRVPPIFRPTAGDPLGYLHAISPGAFNALPPRFPILTTPAASHRPARPSGGVSKAASPEKTASSGPAPPAVKNNPAQRPSESSASSSVAKQRDNPSEPLAILPTWLWLALTLFFGGIGLFSLIGSLSLLRLVFWQELSGDLIAWIRRTAIGKPATPRGLSGEPAVSGIPKSRWESAPPFPLQIPIRWKTGGEPAKVGFADTSFINALDYTTRAPNSIPDAVHGTLRLRFPSSSRPRACRTTANRSATPPGQTPLLSSQV